MLLYTLPPDGPAFPEATAEDWARYDAITFAAAAERRKDEAEADNRTT